MPDSDNGRVTMAILQNEIRHLSEEVKRLRQDLCGKIEAYEERARSVHQDHEERLRTLEGSQGWNVWRDLGTFLAAVGAGLAGFLNK